VCISSGGSPNFDPVDFGASISFTQFASSGAPAAPDGAIQFNDNSSFGGSANFLFNKSATAPTLDIG
jgi:hypothetical protein